MARFPHGREQITEEQRSAAEDVLERYYRQWVDQMAMNLAEQVINDEVHDAEGLQEQLDQDVDSALTYTKDQHLTIQCSNSVGDAEVELEDMGGGDGNAAAQLATLTMRIDVREELERMGLELDGDWDRDTWLAEVAAGDHGDELVEAATKVLVLQVKKLISGDDALKVAWDEHLENNGTAAEFLEEHG